MSIQKDRLSTFGKWSENIFPGCFQHEISRTFYSQAEYVMYKAVTPRETIG